MLNIVWFHCSCVCEVELRGAPWGFLKKGLRTNWTNKKDLTVRPPINHQSQNIWGGQWPRFSRVLWGFLGVL